MTTIVKLGLFAVALTAGIALPYTVGPFLLGTATLGIIYGLFAMSINLLAGYGGLVSLGQAGIMGASAYGVAYVATHTSGGSVEQIVVGLLSCLAVSAVFALMAMRTKGVYFIMVTLAQGMIVYGLANSLAPITGAENGLTGVNRPAFVSQDWQFYYLCLGVLLLCAAAMWVIIRSPFGLALRGLRESETRVRMLGYSPVLHKFYGFMLSGFFAGVAGVLFAYNNQYVSPSVAQFATSAQAVLMIIMGGIGTLSGPLFGAFIIVLAQNWLSIAVSRWPTIEGAVFILMVLFVRSGIVGTISQAWYRFVPARWSRGAAPAVTGLGSPTAGAGDSADSSISGESRRVTP